jgi:hypothetical protein
MGDVLAAQGHAHIHVDRGGSIKDMVLDDSRVARDADV